MDATAVCFGEAADALLAEAASEFAQNHPLSDAAREGDLAAVRALIEGVPGTPRSDAEDGEAGRPAPPHVFDAEPLRWACLLGHADIVKYLMSLPIPAKEHVAALRACNYEGIRVAVDGGYLEIVKTLLPYLNVVDLALSGAIERAARRGNAEVMIALISKYVALSREGPEATRIASFAINRARIIVVDASTAAQVSAGALAVIMYYSKPTWHNLWAYLVHDALGTGVDRLIRSVIRKWGDDLHKAECDLVTADLKSIPLPPDDAPGDAPGDAPRTYGDLVFALLSGAQGAAPRTHDVHRFAMLNNCAPGMAYVSWKCLRARLGV